MSTIFDVIAGKDLLQSIKFIPSFNDDPKVFLYFMRMKHISRYSDGLNLFPEASGFSLTSPEIALFKTLTEGMERFCLASYRRNDGVVSSFNRLKLEKCLALDPYLYINNSEIRDRNFLWMEGTNFLAGAPAYIPAQLLYFSYRNADGEVDLASERNSNGGAGGFSHDFAITRAIYEAVERDAFFSVYLNKITPPRVKISSLSIERAKILEEDCTRYNLEIVLLDITHDLSIPSFMAILIDRTGLGPAVTVGLKSNLNPVEAIMGSLEEVFNTRTTFRRQMPKYKKKLGIKYRFEDINTFELRNLFWSSPQKLHNLDFLLNAPFAEKKYVNVQLSEQEQKNRLKDIFKKKGYPVFDIDLSMDMFKDLGYVVHKAVIPGLQPLYTMERAKYLKTDRLQAVASFFGKKTTQYNPIPHFFL